MAIINKKTVADTFYQRRGWGGEHWIENLPEYCGKILYVEAGKRGSLHFHGNKTETMLLIEGLVHLRMIDTDTGKEYTVELNVGDSIMIPRLQPHQIIGIQTSRIIEFSTLHEESDSFRIQKGD